MARIESFYNLYKQNRIDICHKQLTDFFEIYFKKNKFIEHKPSPLISQCDKSVFFIGSTISVFKQYILKRSIPSNGFFLTQPCLRTQNVKVFKEDHITPRWSSFFTGIGTISNINKLDHVCSCSLNFLVDILKINEDMIKIKASSLDKDLVRYWYKNKKDHLLELDGENIDYYRHRYGMEEIRGRNINFSIIQNDRSFKDIGNLIIIENSKEAMAVELTFGVATLLSRMLSLEHPIKASIISMVAPIDDTFSIKLADALSTATILLYKKIRPRASEHRGRILREYLQSISYLRKKLGYSINDIYKLTSQYCKVEPNIQSDYTTISKQIILYLEQYEYLKDKKNDNSKINSQLSSLF